MALVTVILLDRGFALLLHDLCITYV